MAYGAFRSMRDLKKIWGWSEIRSGHVHRALMASGHMCRFKREIFPWRYILDRGRYSNTSYTLKTSILWNVMYGYSVPVRIWSVRLVCSRNVRPRMCIIQHNARWLRCLIQPWSVIRWPLELVVLIGHCTVIEHSTMHKRLHFITNITSTYKQEYLEIWILDQLLTN